MSWLEELYPIFGVDQNDVKKGKDFGTFFLPDLLLSLALHL